MTSHAIDLLQYTPERLNRARGYYAVGDAAWAHWKYFRFDLAIGRTPARASARPRRRTNEAIDGQVAEPSEPFYERARLDWRRACFVSSV
jgi:hypothetical protein